MASQHTASSYASYLFIWEFYKIHLTTEFEYSFALDTICKKIF